MKTINCVLTISVCFNIGFAAWQVLGPQGADLRSVVMSPGNENILFAGGYNSPSAIYRSTNAGGSWTKVGSFNGYNNRMVIDPSGNLLAASYGVYRSTNGGVNWTYYSAQNVSTYDLAFNISNPLIVYGCGNKWVSGSDYAMYFMKSTDGGINWSIDTMVKGGYSGGYAVAVDPSDPNVVYAGGNDYIGTQHARVFKSTDCGENFTDITNNLGGYFAYSIAVHPTSPNIIYVGTYGGGIQRTTNGGQTWANVANCIYSFCLGTTALNPDFVLDGTRENGIMRSTNAGASWTSITSGLYGRFYYGFALSPSNAQLAYTANDGGVFKTTNMGVSWQDVNTNLYATYVIGMGIAPSNPAIWYAENKAVAIYRTNDYGTTLTRVTNPSTCGELRAMVVHNSDPNTVFALEGSG